MQIALVHKASLADKIKRLVWGEFGVVLSVRQLDTIENWFDPDWEVYAETDLGSGEILTLIKMYTAGIADYCGRYVSSDYY